jgi:hypothetical protein
MPIQLTNLNEQLQNLQVVYQSAFAANRPIEELAELRIYINEVQEKIAEREKYLADHKN